MDKKDIPDKPPTPATMIEPEHCPRCSPDTYNKDMGVNRRYKILCRKCGGVWDWKHLTGYVFVEDKPGKDQIVYVSHKNIEGVMKASNSMVELTHTSFPKKESGNMQVLSFETRPPEWVDCGKYEYDHAEESKRRIIYPDLINCLAYALRFWEKEPYMKLYYCPGHVINSHVPIISEGSPKWLPAEEYGYNYFSGAFGDLLDEYEMNLLKKYFNV